MTGGFVSKNRVRERQTALPNNGIVRMGILGRIDAVSRNDIGDWGPIDSEGSTTPEVMEMTGDYIHAGPPYTDGSNFDCIKIINPLHTVLGTGIYEFHNSYLPEGWNWRYRGGFIDPLRPSGIEYPKGNYLDVLNDPSEYPDLSSLGAQAYARLRPSISTANVGEDIAEMRELTPMLKQTAAHFSSQWKSMGGNMQNVKMLPKKVANDFLLYQFGWKPFLSDMAKIIDAYHHDSRYMQQRYADNNKWVRRRRVNPEITSDELVYQRTDITGVQPEGGMFSGIAVGPKLFTIRRQTYVNVWYEGVFRVYIRAFDRAQSDSSIFSLDELHRQMNKYGAYVSPAVLYRTTPWTWLGDWFTNAGDLIQEAQDVITNQVVSKYMYLMHHTRNRLEFRSKFTTADGQLVDIAWYRENDIKRRLKAGTNFDFGLSSLNARQIAILAALGLSRR